MRFADSAVLVLICVVACIDCKSVFRIGTRINGDRLLTKDYLTSPTKSTYPGNHTILFEYPINQWVSYIELSSEMNVYAEFTLSFDDELLKGSATAILAHNFDLSIVIFGVEPEKAPTDFNPLLHKEVDYTGALVPSTFDEDEELDEDDYYSELAFEDDTILLGNRQAGDTILYETMQMSELTDHLTNHSVVFYYIDNSFITCAKFVVKKAATIGVVYSHVSEHSLKAVIYDTKALSLSAKLFLYGYTPKDIPVEPVPLLPTVFDSRQDAGAAEHGDDGESIPKVTSKLRCMISAGVRTDAVGNADLFLFMGLLFLARRVLWKF